MCSFRSIDKHTHAIITTRNALVVLPVDSTKAGQYQKEKGKTNTDVKSMRRETMDDSDTMVDTRATL